MFGSLTLFYFLFAHTGKWEWPGTCLTVSQIAASCCLEWLVWKVLNSLWRSRCVSKSPFSGLTAAQVSPAGAQIWDQTPTFLLHRGLSIIPMFLLPSFSNPLCQHIKAMFIDLVIYLCPFKINFIQCWLDLPEVRGSKEVSDFPFFLLVKNLLHNLRKLSVGKTSGKEGKG